jgi:hypothetical protein
MFINVAFDRKEIVNCIMKNDGKVKLLALKAIFTTSLFIHVISKAQIELFKNIFWLPYDIGN